jgi:hypothetical protein
LIEDRTKIESKKIKPNLFIVGSPRAGTTALHSFLSQHPEILMSTLKEPEYFCTDIHQESDSFHKEKKYFPYRTKKQYLELFQNVKNEKTIGESSTKYLASTVAAKNIYNFNSKAKIIIILRNPIDILYSLHSRLSYSGVEPIEDFEEALQLEEQRKKGDIPQVVCYPSSLFYSERINFKEKIERYRMLFPEHQVKIIIHELFIKNNIKNYKDVLIFLNIDSGFTPNFTKKNSNRNIRNFSTHLFLSKIMKNKYTHKFVKYIPFRMGILPKLMRANSTVSKRSPMSKKLRLKLMKKYQKEVAELSDYLSIDLTHIWRYDMLDEINADKNN